MKSRTKKVVYVFLFGLLPSSIVLWIIEGAVETGMSLNWKKLKGVGGFESGTVHEYVTNAWVWNAICLAGVAMGIVAFMIGLIMMIESKARLSLEETERK